MKKLLTLLFAAALTLSMTAMAQTSGGDMSKDKDTKKAEKKEKKTAKKAAKKDKKGLREIAEHLFNENANIQSDCLKVLYEVGYLNPGLIAPFAKDFLKLLGHKNNRMVWGSMIALSTIAELTADELYPHREAIIHAMDNGSVITMDAGVKTLAGIASKNEEYRKKLFPYLLKHLETCRLKEVPQHSEKTLVAANAKNKAAFIGVLEKRMESMTASQAARVKRVIKEAAKR